MAMPPGPAQAQDSLERQMTGGSSRAWTLRPLARPPSPGKGCGLGETYTFDTSHKLTINKCRSGEVVADRHGWSISTNGEGGPILAITGMNAYSLTIHTPRHGARLMRLHVDAQPGHPAGDKELIFNED
jgi:hypothetical protein